jgi:MFS family permease
MRKLAESLYSIAIALWVGGLFAVGYLAAPVLFYQLSDRALAGNLAGAMFSIIAWVGLACGGYLLLYLLLRRGWRAIQSSVFWLVLVMAALSLAHFSIEPVLSQLKADALPRQVMESALRDRFSTWHGIASALYLLQSLIGLWLVVWQERGKR